MPRISVCVIPLMWMESAYSFGVAAFGGDVVSGFAMRSAKPLRTMNYGYRIHGRSGTWCMSGGTHLRSTLSPETTVELPTRKIRRTRKWADMIAKLQHFFGVHGHSHVTSHYEEDFPGLYEWTRVIRSKYRHQYESTIRIEHDDDTSDDYYAELSNSYYPSGTPRPILSQEEFELLTDMNFPWDKQEIKWQDKLDAVLLSTEWPLPTRLDRFVVELQDAYRRYVAGEAATFTEYQLSQIRKNANALRIDLCDDRHDRVLATWGEMLERLKTFHHDHQHCRATAERDPELFEWITDIRALYKYQIQKGSKDSSKNPGSLRPALSKDRILSLQLLGFPWQVAQRKRDRKWDDMIDRLEEFYDTYGHSCVLRKHEGYGDLFEWTKMVRRNYSPQVLRGSTTFPNGTRRPKLADERLEQLEHLEFPWDALTLNWQMQVDEVLATGASSISDLPTQLAVFVRNQRREYRRYLRGEEPCSMTLDRIEKLRKMEQTMNDGNQELFFSAPEDSIDIKPTRSHDELWNRRFEELKAFREANGHTHITENYVANPELGTWCMNQRTRYRERKRALANVTRTDFVTVDAAPPTNIMPDERIEKLESLGFAWNMRDWQWKGMLNRLKSFFDERDGEEFENSFRREMPLDLYMWVIRQRLAYNRRSGGESSSMTEERISLMESTLGSKWEWRSRRGSGPDKEDWNQLFSAIREKGIVPGMRSKTHWFDGLRPFETEVKTDWTDAELLDLWNAEDDEDEELDFAMYESGPEIAR